MAQANPKRVWHLSRRDEPPCLVSDQELLLLAELGHLRADDMLWRPDFDGYRPIRSLLGDVPAPKQIRIEATPPSPGPVETTTLYTMPTTTLGSAKRRLSLVGVAGLLVVMALLAGLGLVTYRFLETNPQPATQDAAVTEPIPTPPKSQSASTEPTSTPVQEPPETATTGSPAGSARQAEHQQEDAETDVIVRTVKVVDIDPPETPKASASVATPAPEDSSSAVPSPIKKPAKPAQSLRAGGEEQASSATSGRMPEAPGLSPMGLGPFDFNSAN